MGYGTMEEKLAALLLAHQGEPLSGEAISRQMGVTRAAVWKGMDRLRQAGWEIGSATNRGYRLVEVPDLMTAPVVEHFLPRTERPRFTPTRNWIPPSPRASGWCWRGWRAAR